MRRLRNQAAMVTSHQRSRDQWMCRGNTGESQRCAGINSSTRIRCRVVSLIPGRCFMALANTSRGLVEIVAGIKQALDLRAVLGPLFDLVEVAIVRAQRVVSFFAGPSS